MRRFGSLVGVSLIIYHPGEWEGENLHTRYAQNHRLPRGIHIHDGNVEGALMVPDILFSLTSADGFWVESYSGQFDRTW